MLTIGDLLKVLMDRAGMNQVQFASVVRVEREHLNAVMNGRQEGTPDMIDRALQHLGMTWSDVLVAPPSKQLKDDQKELRFLERVIARGGRDRDFVVGLIGLIRRQVDRRLPGPAGPEGPKKPRPSGQIEHPRERTEVAA